LDGLNPSIAVIDEYHAHKNRGLVDVIETAQGARREPLLFFITTAGVDLMSPCASMRDYVRRILEGILIDDRLFGFVAHADQDDDPFLVRTWKKANPMYGISVNAEDIKRLAKQAKGLPAALAMFKTKRLNIWVEGGEPWLNLERWRASQSPAMLEPDSFGDRACCIGVDLASKIDLTAVMIAFHPTDDDPVWRLVPRYWTPESDLDAREHRARAPFREWIRAGYLRRIDGARIDQAVIREYLIESCGKYNVQLIGVDPWNAASLIAQLTNEIGTTRVVEVPQTVNQLSDPSKEFEAELLAGKLDAGGCPVTTWMLGNAVVKVDANGNIFPSKARARGHIDGLIAAILAIKMSRYAESEIEADSRSVYEDRGLLTL
jgi:phage terminase large subunit-like protein